MYSPLLGTPKDTLRKAFFRTLIKEQLPRHPAPDDGNSGIAVVLLVSPAEKLKQFLGSQVRRSKRGSRQDICICICICMCIYVYVDVDVDVYVYV